MSEAEKAARLKEMMSDADAHDKAAWARLQESIAENEREVQERLTGSGEHKASFINKMNKEVYGGSNNDLEDRLAKNKNSRQKGNMAHNRFL